MKPPYAIGSVTSLSGHAIAYRWRSLPRVRRHRASKPHGSFEWVLPWQITMDQLIFASLSHTHYWYEVGMLKVPAVYSKSMDQPVVVANPARSQLNRESQYFFLSAFVPENLVSREGFGSPVTRQPVHLHTSAESGVRDSRVPRRDSSSEFAAAFTATVNLGSYLKPPYVVGSVPSLSGHAITCRWRSLPRVRRDRDSKPQGSSERVLPWQITMDQ
ncbi:unnamed protein product [Ascophyllum nodosum]